MSAGSRAPLKLAILISGRGSNMVAIARACLAGKINARIRVVISDSPGAGGLASTGEQGIGAMTIPGPGAGERGGFEHALTDALYTQPTDLVVLAGFMRILSPGFVAHYAGRMLNIHPSLLPKYTGLHPHRRAPEPM